MAQHLPDQLVDGPSLAHGHYCRNRPRSDGSPPVDALDAACRRYLSCRPGFGAPRCGCVGELQSVATRLSRDGGTPPGERRDAAVVASAMGQGVCR